MTQILICGASLSGLIIANLYAICANKKVLIIEKENEICKNKIKSLKTIDENILNYIQHFSYFVRLGDAYYPLNGYDEFCNNLINNENITLKLNEDYNSYIYENYDSIFISGKLRNMRYNTTYESEDNYTLLNDLLNLNIKKYPKITNVHTSENNETYYKIKSYLELHNTLYGMKLKCSKLYFIGSTASYTNNNIEDTFLNAFSLFQNLCNFVDFTTLKMLDDNEMKAIKIVKKFYNDILKREPDNEGLHVYTKFLLKENCSKICIDELQDILYNSDEYYEKKDIISAPKRNEDIKILFELKDTDIVNYFGYQPNACLQETPPLVVSRYNENISWTKLYNKVYIYNKGEQLENTNHNVYYLDNIGREGHTYLSHIIDNYNNLDEYIIFCQGDPFEHAPDFIKLTKKHYTEFKEYQPLSWRWKDNDVKIDWLNNENNTGIPPMECREKFKELYIEDCRIYAELLDNEFQSVFPYKWVDGGFNAQLIPRTRIRNNIDDNCSVLQFVYNKIGLKTEIPKYIPFNFSAVFGVSKKRIHEHSLETYVKLRDFLLEHSDNGYILERLWMHLFSMRNC